MNNLYIRIVKRLIHYFIPEKLKADKELFRKASFVSAACLLICFITLFSMIYAIYEIHDPVYISIGTAFFTIILLSMFVFKKTGSFTFMALFVNGVSFLGLCSATMATGGIYSPDIYSLLIIPVFALTISSRRIALFWTLIVILTFIMFYIIEESGAYTLKQGTEQVGVFYYFQDTIILSAILFFLVFRNESLRLELLNEVKKSHSEISDKNKEITDSITYAKRIQKALMSNEKSIEKTMDRLRKN